MAVPVLTESLQTATISIQGQSALLYGSMVDPSLFPKKNKESHDDYEKRTWRERCHYDAKRRLYVPGYALKRMIETAARYEGERIKGGGMKTKAGKLKCGLQVPEAMVITPHLLVDDVDGLWKMVPSRGKTGGGSRVPRCFPILQNWSGTFEVLLIDEKIKKEWVEEAAVRAGIINGLGTWRPQSGGNYGRFTVTDITWNEIGDLGE